MPGTLLAHGQAEAGEIKVENVSEWHFPQLHWAWPCKERAGEVVATENKPNWSALGLRLQDLKKIKKKDSKYFTEECSSGVGHEGLVVPFTHWITSMSGKLTLTLCGCFCADDWVQNMSASISLVWEGFVPAVLRVPPCRGQKRRKSTPWQFYFLKKGKKNSTDSINWACSNQGKCFFLTAEVNRAIKNYLDAVLWVWDAVAFYN